MPADASTMISRRNFLRARTTEIPPAIRPPWFDVSAVSRCTGCNACVQACPEDVLRPDGRNVPELVLDGNACTFCGDCAAACDADIFDLSRTPPWEVLVAMEPGCLMEIGISCRLCSDACDSDALIFDARAGRVGAVRVVAENCTGCGACVGLCPEDVLKLVKRGREAA